MLCKLLSLVILLPKTLPVMSFIYSVFSRYLVGIPSPFREEKNMRLAQGRLLKRRFKLLLILLIAGSLWSISSLHSPTAHAAPAENNGVGATPFMGWSTWNFIGRHPTEANVKAQALAEANT